MLLSVDWDTSISFPVKELEPVCHMESFLNIKVYDGCRNENSLGD
jgi:hypothetical protein